MDKTDKIYLVTKIRLEIVIFRTESQIRRAKGERKEELEEYRGIIFEVIQGYSGMMLATKVMEKSFDFKGVSDNVLVRYSVDRSFQDGAIKGLMKEHQKETFRLECVKNWCSDNNYPLNYIKNEVKKDVLLTHLIYFFPKMDICSIK